MGVGHLATVFLILFGKLTVDILIVSEITEASPCFDSHANDFGQLD